MGVRLLTWLIIDLLLYYAWRMLKRQWLMCQPHSVQIVISVRTYTYVLS